MLYFCIALLFAVACYGQDPQPQPQPQPGLIAALPGSSQICVTRNGYYKQDGSCDSYIECRDFIATKMLCPEGLNYNPDATWPNYPCGYPMDVPCRNRGAPQPAKPTADCPHQYGFYPSLIASPDQCGRYRMCVAGQAIEMECPVGLAFNSATGRCDWPDLVSDCNKDDFLGFKCPAAPLGDDGLPLDISINYKYEGECYYFFSCVQGRARLLSCDYGLAFDAASGRCVDADLVKCSLQPAVPQ